MHSATSCSAPARLAELGKLDLACPSVLARFGVAQVKDGHKVGCRLNVRDVRSPYCQRQKKITVQRLDVFDEQENCWTEILLEEKTVGPAELAAKRLADHGITVPTPKTWTLRIDEELPADLESPFFVRTPVSSWKRGEIKRRCGTSSSFRMR